MVIPERVELERIHLLPPAGRGDRGGARRRRELLRPREAAGEAVLLRLPAAGTELYVLLRRDLRFLARGFVVEHRRGEERRPPAERLCFYTGRVLNRSDSFASLSTCAGLVLPPRPRSDGPRPRFSPCPSADPAGFPVGTYPSPLAPTSADARTCAPAPRLSAASPRAAPVPCASRAELRRPRGGFPVSFAREPPGIAGAGKVSRIASSPQPRAVLRCPVRTLRRPPAGLEDCPDRCHAPSISQLGGTVCHLPALLFPPGSPQRGWGQTLRRAFAASGGLTAPGIPRECPGEMRRSSVGRPLCSSGKRSFRCSGWRLAGGSQSWGVCLTCGYRSLLEMAS